MPIRPTKWDLVLEQRPIAMLDHLVGELGRLLAEELAVWPPGLEPADAREAQRLAGLLERHPTRPDPRVFDEAFTLAQRELAHEVDAIDDYFRNRRYLEVGLGPDDRELLLFLSRLVVEQLLALGEATEGRLDRRRLRAVLARARADSRTASPPE
jgi:hypothetical protein